jgi:hypothetical protein
MSEKQTSITNTGDPGTCIASDEDMDWEGSWNDRPTDVFACKVCGAKLLPQLEEYLAGPK